MQVQIWSITACHSRVLISSLQDLAPVICLSILSPRLHSPYETRKCLLQTLYHYRMIFSDCQKKTDLKKLLGIMRSFLPTCAVSGRLVMHCHCFKGSWGWTVHAPAKIGKLEFRCRMFSHIRVWGSGYAFSSWNWLKNKAAILICRVSVHWPSF